MLTLTRPRIAAQPSAATVSAAQAAAVLPSTGPAHADDVAGLADLTARGHARLTLRWTHHLFAPDEAATAGAAGRLEALGWTVGLHTAMPAPFPGWQLRVHRDTVLDAAALDEARAAFGSVAAETGACYDGWDAALPPATAEDRR